MAARRLDELQAAADRAAGNRVLRAREAIASLAARLESLSPLAVLGRGYSLTRRTEGGPAIRDARELSVGDPLLTRFARAETVSRVEEIFDGPSPARRRVDISPPCRHAENGVLGELLILAGRRNRLARNVCLP